MRVLRNEAGNRCLATRGGQCWKVYISLFGTNVLRNEAGNRCLATRGGQCWKVYISLFGTNVNKEKILFGLKEGLRLLLNYAYVLYFFLETDYVYKDE